MRLIGPKKYHSKIIYTFFGFITVQFLIGDIFVYQAFYFILFAYVGYYVSEIIL